MLDARLRSTLGTLELDVTLSVADGGTLVLAGGSGAGKTSVLRLLAGLDSPREGQVSVNGVRWSDATRRLNLAPSRRSVGWVPQEGALFPHLSVRENVEFGRRSTVNGKRSTLDRRPLTVDLLEQCGAQHLADRQVTTLSGGERQRVALARALAVDPELLLLDEPLSALDPESRASLRATLASVIAERRGLTLLVTHHPLEALALGTRIAVMEQGRIIQEGTSEELLVRPRSHSVAAFLGANFFRGSVIARPEPGLAELSVAGGRLTVVDPGGDGEVLAVVSPSSITLSRSAPEGSARNVFHGTVREVVPEPPHGERLRVALDTAPPLVAEVTAAGARALGLTPGVSLFASFKATGVEGYR
ncbi:MAG TPA: ABC transporter ATP-binding protein [Gemmatimonadales bacterium]|nr:ABC transporter ATP-binding protein [Gemmatimonadales bacterium]